MALIFLRVFAVLMMTHLGSHAFEWTSALPDHSVQYVCAGDILTLPWSYTTTPGDSILSVKWYFQGASEQLIAIYFPPHFAPISAFANRVQMASAAGIALSQVTTADTGNYNVQVSSHDSSGGVFTYNRTVVVQVMENDTLMTTDGDLHAMLELQARYSDTTGRWSLVLSCGNFTYLSDPPFTMEWQTPSKTPVASDGYTDGHFLLHVTSGGDYTCRIPQQAAADVCLSNASSRHATVHVDRVEARMTLIEAEVKQLKQKETKMTDYIRTLEARLDNKDSGLSHSLQNLVSKVSHQVAFTTYLARGHTSGGTVIFGIVINNYGDGYSAGTGNFTAPVAGLYFFMLTSSPQTNNDNPEAVIYHDGRDLCHAGSNTGMPGKVASCGAAVQLSAGQRVYVTSNYHLTDVYTSFSGFLINSA